MIEINHINGGGRKELLAQRNKYYRSILNLEREIEDLELTCKVCNSLHALELKYGPLPFIVLFQKEQNDGNERPSG